MEREASKEEGREEGREENMRTNMAHQATPKLGGCYKRRGEENPLMLSMLKSTSKGWALEHRSASKGDYAGAGIHGMQERQRMTGTVGPRKHQEKRLPSSTEG